MKAEQTDGVNAERSNWVKGKHSEEVKAIKKLLTGHKKQSDLSKNKVIGKNQLTMAVPHGSQCRRI